jgi:DNA-binding transcriptional LysR family regulator
MASGIREARLAGAAASSESRTESIMAPDYGHRSSLDDPMIRSILFVQMMKLGAIDLNLLLAFDALVTEASVTKAAAKLNTSQPAMSGALARLRLRFGDPLFVRSGGRMRPTARALQLAGPIAEALALLRQTIEPETAFRPERSTRSFTIAATDYVEALLLGPLMSALSKIAPGLSLRTIRPPQAFVPPEEALRSGEADLALGLFAAAVRPRPDLLSQPLYRDRFVAVVRARHPRVGRRLTLRVFLSVPQIRIVYPNDAASGLMDTVLASLGRERRVALTIASLVPVPAIVARSDLLGLAPERLAREWARARPLRLLEVPVAGPDLPLTMVWDSNRQRDPAQAWLRETIRRELSDL